jgi:hypothetical protein
MKIKLILAVLLSSILTILAISVASYAADDHEHVRETSQ